MRTENQQKLICDALEAIGVNNFVIALPDPDEPETFYVWRMSGGVAYDLGRVKEAVLAGVPRETIDRVGFSDEYSVIKG